MDELLEALVTGEEANFSLFNYVNDLTGEVDKLEESIGTLRCRNAWACWWEAWAREAAAGTGRLVVAELTDSLSAGQRWATCAPTTSTFHVCIPPLLPMHAESLQTEPAGCLSNRSAPY